ncbi:N-acetyltransferase [Aquibium carbonis]|uniref:N-acetyltransferase n=1 Tax=Aquibium carbonis TaxID=2495581 RepID=A0A429Z175_9HYPH|nr:N-acetyltransferase [Aquibium carbonis]RST87461.1 N-acetyltransferase [Aquibium carbonis]
MSAFIIRPAKPEDRAAIRGVEERAFGRPDEANLAERLVADGDVVLELVAERHGEILGHVLFSRLQVVTGAWSTPAVSLAPLAVDPAHQQVGIGTELVREGHLRLMAQGESLSVVLGDPAYYARFGYTHDRAAGFECTWQGDALQAIAFEEAPQSGRIVYARAFDAI